MNILSFAPLHRLNHFEENALHVQLKSYSLPQELAEWNRRYEAKFGHVFLICAQDKSSSDILAALKVCTFQVSVSKP